MPARDSFSFTRKCLVQSSVEDQPCSLGFYPYLFDKHKPRTRPNERACSTDDTWRKIGVIYKDTPKEILRELCRSVRQRSTNERSTPYGYHTSRSKAKRDILTQ